MPRKTIASQQEIIDTQHKKLSDISDRFYGMQAEKNRLSLLLGNINTTITDQTNEIKSLREYVTTLQTTLREQQEAHDGTINKLAYWEKIAKDLEEVLTKREITITGLNQIIEEMTEDKNLVAGRYDHEIARITAEQEHYQRLAATAKEDHDRRVELELDRQQTLKANDSLTHAAQTLRLENKELIAQLKDLTRQILSLEDVNRKHITQIHMMSESNNKLRERIAAYEVAPAPTQDVSVVHQSHTCPTPSATEYKLELVYRLVSALCTHLGVKDVDNDNQ